MEKNNSENQTILENSIYSPRQQKVSKRIAAWIVDFILFIILATGFAFLVSKAYNYDKYTNIVNDKCIVYNVATKNEETGKIEFLDENLPEVKENYVKLYADKEFLHAYEMQQRGIIVIVTSAVGLSYFVLEFVMPLIWKHGRTLGMRFFDTGYVTDDGIDPPFKSVFVRFLFGKLILEGLIPTISLLYIIHGTGMGLIGIIALIAIGGANGYLLLFHADKRGLHDYISRMKPVDNSNQIYIKTTEELARLKAEESIGQNGLRK